MRIAIRAPSRHPPSPSPKPLRCQANDWLSQSEARDRFLYRQASQAITDYRQFAEFRYGIHGEKAYERLAEAAPRLLPLLTDPVFVGRLESFLAFARLASWPMDPWSLWDSWAMRAPKRHVFLALSPASDPLPPEFGAYSQALSQAGTDLSVLFRPLAEDFWLPVYERAEDLVLKAGDKVFIAPVSETKWLGPSHELYPAAWQTTNPKPLALALGIRGRDLLPGPEIGPRSKDPMPNARLPHPPL